MNQLLIATSNKGKVAEFRELLAGSGISLVTPEEIGLTIEVEEDGADYKANAGKKALEYSRASGLVAIADDSGLEVDVLGGAPGLYSARFSPKPGATDADRRHYLLQMCSEKPEPWKAFFHATVAIATPTGALVFTEGKCDGEVQRTEAGANGFGYDSIFLIPSLKKTMAELTMDEKNILSHRAIAVKLAIPFILDLLDSN